MLSLLTFVAFIYSASAVGCGYGQVTFLDSEYNYTAYEPLGVCISDFDDGASSSYKITCETDTAGDKYPLLSEYNDLDCTGEDLNRTLNGDFVGMKYLCSGLKCATAKVYVKENSTDDECSNYANWPYRMVHYSPTGVCLDSDEEDYVSMESTCASGALTVEYYETQDCNSSVADTETYGGCNADGTDDVQVPIYYEIICNSAAAVKTLFAMVVGVAFVFLV